MQFRSRKRLVGLRLAGALPVAAAALLALVSLLAVPILYADDAAPQRDLPVVELTGAELEYLRQLGPVRMAVDPDWYPYELITQDGEFTGIAAELIALITSRTGVEIELVITQDWAESLEASRTGRCHILAFLNQTPQRNEWLLFTEPYFVDQNVFVTREEHEYISDPARLSGVTVVLPEGTSVEERIRRDYPNLTVLTVQTEAQCFEMVSNREADMTLRSLTMAAYTIRSAGYFNLKIAGQLPEYANHLRIGVVKDEPMLRDILDKGVRTITPQEVQAAINKYIAITVVTPFDYGLLVRVAVGLLVVAATVLAWTRQLRRLNRRLEQTNQALRYAEERTLQLARQSRTYAWEVDATGLYTYVDDVAEEVIGYRPDELVGKKHFYDLQPESQRQEYKAVGLEVMGRGEKLSQYENPVVTQDGRLLWFSSSGMPLRGQDGEIVGYRGWDMDITDRKRAEMSIRRSEERFRSLFEQSMDAIIIASIDGQVIEANQAWLDLFGYTRDELAEITVLDMYADIDDRQKFLQRMQEDGRVQDEVRYKKKDGTVFICERTVVARRDENGDVAAYQGIMRDITERNRAREELERLARFDTLTGLPNRRTVLERLVDSLRHCHRYHERLSVVMVDIDHFKLVNDNYGHKVGDQVLIDVARLLEASIRETDHAGRYGGEEFLFVLPQTDVTGAVKLAERTRELVMNTPMRDHEGNTFTVTISLGVAEWCVGDTEDSLVSRADSALYAAKNAGRNRTEVMPCPHSDTADAARP